MNGVLPMPESFRSPSKVIRRLRLTGLASREIANWPSFMYHYALGCVPSAAYRFRSGARLKIGRGVDHVPIIEIFLRRDYGTIADNSVIVDLGAHIGTFSIFARTTARGVRLFAYEPAPELFALLRENVRLNGLDGTVTCTNAAVGGTSEVRKLFVNGTNLFPTLIRNPRQSSSESVRVQCTTLADIIDSTAQPTIDLLKMDVEGSEYEILYSTAPEYLRRITEIRMEYHGSEADEHNSNEMKNFLTSHGYAITYEQRSSDANGLLWASRHD